MSEVDRLFDPERLRDLWGMGERKAEAAKADPEAPAGPPPEVAKLDALSRAIERDYGPRGAPLERLVKRARDLFREKAANPAGAAKAIPALVAVLDDLEEVLDAVGPVRS